VNIDSVTLPVILSHAKNTEILRRSDVSGLLRMTTLNKISKGGDAYGKVPKRIVVARSLLLFIARSRRRRGNLK